MDHTSKSDILPREDLSVVLGVCVVPGSVQLLFVRSFVHRLTPVFFKLFPFLQFLFTSHILSMLLLGRMFTNSISPCRNGVRLRQEVVVPLRGIGPPVLCTGIT